MAKKDTTTAVLGMLSTAGAQTRSTSGTEPVTEPARVADTPAPAPAGERSAPPAAPEPEPQPRAIESGEAPRTMRLRSDTAASLRSAWLQAKRDDVLLTAQDFASDLVEHALGLRARTARRAPASSPVG